MYISVCTWRDLTDGHLYHAGEQFPCDGREISAERIQSLIDGRNQAGLRLIEAVEVPDEEKPVQPQETPERPKTARKTASRTRRSKE